MSINPDINKALGTVTCEPDGNGGVRLFANDVDITDEIVKPISIPMADGEDF